MFPCLVYIGIKFLHVCISVWIVCPRIYHVYISVHIRTYLYELYIRTYLYTYLSLFVRICMNCTFVHICIHICPGLSVFVWIVYKHIYRVTYRVPPMVWCVSVSLVCTYLYEWSIGYLPCAPVHVLYISVYLWAFSRAVRYRLCKRLLSFHEMYCTVTLPLGVVLVSFFRTAFLYICTDSCVRSEMCIFPWIVGRPLCICAVCHVLYECEMYAPFVYISPVRLVACSKGLCVRFNSMFAWPRGDCPGGTVFVLI